MKRWLITLLILALLGGTTIPAAFWLWGRVEPPIRVGILHSKHGPMAISEESMIDAEVMALAGDQPELVAYWGARSSGSLPMAVPTGPLLLERQSD